MPDIGARFGYSGVPRCPVDPLKLVYVNPAKFSSSIIHPKSGLVRR
jgi:hypothetical protein